MVDRMSAWKPTLVQTREQLRELEAKALRIGICGLDTESSGPQLRDTSKTAKGNTRYLDFINMQLSTTVGWSIAFPDHTAYYVPMCHTRGNAPYRESLNTLRTILYDCPTILIHNLVHELIAFARLGLSTHYRGNLLCSQVLAWITHHGVRKGDAWTYRLKEWALKYEGYKMATFKEVTQGRSFSELLPEEGLQYACDDAVGALLVYDRCWPVLTDWGLEDTYRHQEMPCVWACREMEDTGVSIDYDLAESLHVEFAGLAEEAREEVEFLTKGSVKNPNSSKQLQTLYDEGYLNIANAMYTKKKALAFGKQAREKQLFSLPRDSEGSKILEAIGRFKDYAKLAGTYTSSLVELAQQYPDGRLHPSYKPTGTITGRLSSKYPCGQNMPTRSAAGKRLLEMFRAEPGYVWGSADYSQIDLRVLAHFAGGGLRKAYQDGADIHQRTAELVGCSRGQAKTVNFAKVYGAHYAKMAYTMGCSIKEAKRFMETYEASYPEVMRLIERVHKAVYQRGYVKTLSGRRRLFPELHGKDRSISRLGFQAVNQGICDKADLMRIWKSEREAVNTICQGGAADIMKAAMAKMVVEGHDFSLMAQIHDDARWEADTHYSYAEGVQQTMQSVYPELTVPLAVDVAGGYSYRELKG